MPDYTIPAVDRLTDRERGQLAALAGLIPADHPLMWSDAALLRSACRATGRPVPNCSRSTRAIDRRATLLNARVILQITSEA
jgi:hypothetical protein